MSQTLHKFVREKYVDLLLGNIENLIRNVPIFELENKPDSEAVALSYGTMSAASE